MIIVVDFDGTLVEEINFPNWGMPNRKTLIMLKVLKKQENRVYLKELTKKLLEDKVLLYTEIFKIKEKINEAEYLAKMFGHDEPDED